MSRDSLTPDRDTQRPEAEPKPSNPGDPNKLKLTSWLQILVAVLAGATIGWLLVGIFTTLNRTQPVTPWTLAAVLAALAVAGFIWALLLKRRIHQDRSAVDNQEAVFALVSGKTMVLAGAALIGAHLVLAIPNFNNLQAPLPQHRLLIISLTICASLLFSLAGSRLEHACIAPGDSGDDEARPKGGVSINPA